MTSSRHLEEPNFSRALDEQNFQDIDEPSLQDIWTCFSAFGARIRAFTMIFSLFQVRILEPSKFFI